ncbi:MAG TPA: phosphoadenylyl-sulfate reductase [Candidatus Baltobacteraceae bacterium]|nr:phosphoadenylyl-sulfate reductase [Candidatus Baltobacteraceae bacterium]
MLLSRHLRRGVSCGIPPRDLSQLRVDTTRSFFLYRPPTLQKAEHETVARKLENASPQEIVAWSLDTHRGKIALACSFGGPTGIAALDMVMALEPATPIYFIDTGLLFWQTHQLIERISRHYGIAPIAVRPQLSLDEQRELYGDELWKRNPDLCCALRKVEPQRLFLRGFDAWISGVRRDQTPDRSALPVVTWDERHEVVKVSPFAVWSEQRVWQYVRDRNLPYNELHDASYPSIGCVPCTRAVAPGEGLREGRWPGSAKLECGLHVFSAVRGEAS